MASNIITLSHDVTTQYDLSSLPGAILINKGETASCGKNCTTDVYEVAPGTYIKAGIPTPKIEPITTPNSFTSIVTNKFSTSGQATASLASITLSLSNNQVGDLSIIDTEKCSLKRDDMDGNSVAKFNSANPFSPGEKRYWVQGVVLCVGNMKIFDEIDTKATATSAIVKADGNFYASTNQAKQTLYIKATLIPIANKIGSFKKSAERFAEVQSLSATLSSNINGVPEVTLKKFIKN